VDEGFIGPEEEGVEPAVESSRNTGSQDELQDEGVSNPESNNPRE